MYIADTPNKAPFAGIFDQVGELKTRLSTAAKQSATIAYALTGPEPSELAPAQLGSPAVLQGVSGSASVIYSNATPLRY